MSDIKTFTPKGILPFFCPKNESYLSLIRRIRILDSVNTVLDVTNISNLLKLVFNDRSSGRVISQNRVAPGGVMNKPPRKRNKATSASSSEDTPPDNLTQEENPGTAIITVTAVEIPELTEQEISDRLHLERKVERAFFEAGKALAELRDRRLYRSTHKTFEEYCRDRFSYTYRHVNYLIAGCLIVDNIKVGTNSSQNESQDEMGTNSSHFLPTSEVQVRPLAKLEPQQQPEAWQ
jgi:hypothetical protein